MLYNYKMLKSARISYIQVSKSIDCIKVDIRLAIVKCHYSIGKSYIKFLK